MGESSKATALTNCMTLFILRMSPGGFNRVLLVSASCLGGNFGCCEELTGSLTDFGTASLDGKANQDIAELKVQAHSADHQFDQAFATLANTAASDFSLPTGFQEVKLPRKPDSAGKV